MNPPQNSLHSAVPGGAEAAYAPGSAAAAASAIETPAAVATGSEPTVKPKERFVYLDAMKGVMILWGIPVHACVISHSKFFHLVSDISNCVRMEAFFMISGFLSYMLVKRYGAGTIMKKRTIATGIPFLTVVLLLNPITNWLILHYQAGKMGVPAPTLGEFFTGKIPVEFFAEGAPTWNWHLHIWFLAVLLCLASLSAPIMTVLDRAKATLKGVTARMPDWLLLTLTGTVAVVCCVAARMGYEVAVKPFVSPSFHYPLRMVGYYFAFFAMGMAMFTSSRLLKIFTRFHWMQLGLGCVLLWAARLFQAAVKDGGVGAWPVADHPMLKKLAEVVGLSAEVYLAVVFVPVLFTFFKRFCSGTEGTMRLSAVHWVNLVASAGLLFAATKFEYLLPSGVNSWSEIPLAMPAFVDRIWLTPAKVSEFVMLGVEGYFFVMVCLVIFGLFERFVKKAGAPMHFVAESAFCVYLFHYLVIYLNAFWLRDWVGIKNDYALSFLVVLFTTAITMLTYEYAVSRNPVLKCLFLGKIPKKEKAKSAA
ncbi:acyltransferase family protein [Haloferula sp. BvORR071]|uniref:acyltransferase family protein n=1 Tax=Haloferula sp. BvORR071 TaxID=1396141 RepID=UPI00054CF8BB|nr:acyltransferase family protein [Haloferula sp. BvORR071]